MTSSSDTIGFLLTDAAGRLAGENRAAARIEALALMRTATGFSDNAAVLAREREAPSARARDAFELNLQRRLRGEPMAYVLGRREFYGREFLINSAVLIPRPETELLVELGLDFLSKRESESESALRILDLGTGSGVIGISLRLESGDANCEWVLTDNNKAALEVARENAAKLGANGLEFRTGDFYDAVRNSGRFDLIVCNPPYVAEDDECLRTGDLRFEPRAALASGVDGFSALRIVIGRAPEFLNPTGKLMAEHGAGQGAECRRLAEEAGLTEVETVRDLAGLERVTVGTRR